LYLLTAVLCLPGARAADAPVAVDTDPDGKAAEEPVDVDADLKGTYAADVYQRRISENINSAAQWVDSFFDDERYIAEDASSKLRFGQSVFLEYGANPELNTRLNLSVDVPRTEKRLRLFIGSEDDANPTSEQLPDSVDDDTGRDGSAAGVQFFAKASDKQNLSLSAGIKVSSADLFIGPRYRRTVNLDNWLFRFTQRFRWYTGQGWESRTRLDFERIVGQNLFFRQTFDGRWREEDPGYRYESRSSVIQALKRRKAVEYQWANLFNTHPQQRLVSTVFRLRYRQNFLRKWLFYEMNPQLAFRNDEHFKPKAGIVLRIEAVFGGKDFLKSHSDNSDSR
jgi:hypothetical protein